jgi:hypothetical protein
MILQFLVFDALCARSGVQRSRTQLTSHSAFRVTFGRDEHCGHDKLVRDGHDDHDKRKRNQHNSDYECGQSYHAINNNDGRLHIRLTKVIAGLVLC